MNTHLSLVKSPLFIQCSQRKPDPAQVFGQCISRYLVGVTIDAHDKALAGEVFSSAEFEEGYQTT
jgi:hypothetical protein